MDDFLESKYGLNYARILGENSEDLKGNKLDLTKDAKLKKAMEKGVLEEAVQNQKRLEEMDRKDAGE